MADKFVHAVDTRTNRKVRVPEQHLKIFPYLKARSSKSGGARPTTETKPDTKGGK